MCQLHSSTLFALPYKVPKHERVHGYPCKSATLQVSAVWLQAAPDDEQPDTAQQKPIEALLRPDTFEDVSSGCMSVYGSGEVRAVVQTAAAPSPVLQSYSDDTMTGTATQTCQAIMVRSYLNFNAL